MHPHTERGVQRHPPVAELVPEALDDEGAVGRQYAGRLLLLIEQGDEVVGGPIAEAHGSRLCRPVGAGERGEFAGEPPDGATEFGGAAHGVSHPEGQPARLAEGGGDQYPVVGDLFDPPGGSAQGEDIAHPGLVDHLLVELAHAGGLLAHHEHPEQAAVGNRAARGHGEPPGPRPAGECAGVAIPHQPWPKLAEVLRRIPTGEQIENRLVGGIRECRIGMRAAYQREPVVHIEHVHRRGRHGLLRQHVERITRHGELLDRALAHPLHGDGAVQQISAMLGKEDAAAGLAHLVPCATDALQAGRHRWWCLHLDHQIDSAHVDPELQAGCGHHAAQPPRFQIVLDDRALLLAHRTVVSACEHSLRPMTLAAGEHLRGSTPGHGGIRCARVHARGQLIDPRGEPLRQPPGVGEDDGGPVPPDEVDDRGLDVRPQGTLLHRLVFVARDHVEFGHVRHRDGDGQVELLLRGWPHHGGRARAAEEGRHLLRGLHGGREPDPLRGPFQQCVEPLQRQRQVRAAFGARDRVHLVDDHRVHARQRLAGL
ncbi:hypothetical protein TPAU25S_01374 [Tsukamurella paurometabola]